MQEVTVITKLSFNKSLFFRALCGSTIPSPYISLSHYIYVLFRVGKLNGREGDGFIANYTTIQPGNYIF